MPSRRRIITSLIAAAGLGLVGALANLLRKTPVSMKQFPLGFQWPVQEPFIFCAHHFDHYPVGESNFGPKPAALAGRDMGQDFDPANPYRMYHGAEVPGFPVHPHRGFETITIVRKGYVDHADSLGAAGRYGEGDVQWMTAGAGVQHSEMFPLVKQNDVNTLELFQIWLNLPRRSKKVPAHFTMFWSERIPRATQDRVDVTVIAGGFDQARALKPPPDSWAADAANEVSILLLKFEAGGRITIPKSAGATNATLYFFEGSSLMVDGKKLAPKTGAIVDAGGDVTIQSPDGPAEALWMRARAIGEPVVQHGPFVMNTREEISQTIRDYQTTEFGGWPWERPDVVHGGVIERFAKYPDGQVERPNSQA